MSVAMSCTVVFCDFENCASRHVLDHAEDPNTQDFDYVMDDAMDEGWSVDNTGFALCPKHSRGRKK